MLVCPTQLAAAVSATNAPIHKPIAACTLTVVIPLFNERSTIERVLERVASLPIQTQIIVVDDCSTDGGSDLLRNDIEPLYRDVGHSLGLTLSVIYKTRNEGKGAALRTGFAAATGDLVVVQDADLEYNPADILSLLEPILAGQADAVFGSRFLGAEVRDRSWVHRCGNRLLTWASNLTTGLRLTDMETCYKVFRADVLRDIPIQQNRFGFEPEITAKLARRKARIVELPIGYSARGYAEGKKIGLKDLWNALYCIVRYGIRD